jgi:AbrB family looped-hinge helix DNA binding protein
MGHAVQAVRVSSKGWVVIPKDLREKYGIKPGSEVAIVDYAGTLAIVPVPADPVAAMRGMFKGVGGSWTEQLVEEHRREREREERRIAG